MTAELNPSPDENGDKELDFMLGTYDKDKRISQIATPSAIKPPSTYSYKWEDVVWRNVLAFIYLHVSSFYGMYLIATGQVKLSTFIFGYLYGIFGAIGVTAGAHRLWAHGAYKATWQLRCLLMVMQTMAFQNSIWEWVRDHRVHHKYTDTNADPHNYSRGFFFAHMGWLMVKKHPMVKEKGRQIDLGDIERDPICRFQRKYYLLLMPVLAFIVPTAAMYYVFGQSFSTALHSSNLRYFLSLHYAWLVNSAAHFWGDKPFDKDIKPTDNAIIAFITIGEGWHNYHHVFPWDYKAAELGNYVTNLTTSFIDFFANVGYLTAGFAALGVTAGAHRLWTHNGYKAKWPLKVLWMCLNSMAFQNSIYEWARDHRAHHKFTDTDADPHNYSRGFFFAHMGWLMIKKHPDVKLKGSTIDMSDLERDPIVMFQKKYYLILMPIFAFVIPPYLCHYLTGDSLSTCWYIAGIFKYSLSLHWAWLVNSAAHVWGNRPYDKGINPADNKFVALVTNGEGWHNYHHVFPWDYKAAELHTYGYNLCTAFIDLAAWFGQAYDLRTVSDELIRKRALRTGDVSLLDADKHQAWAEEMKRNGRLQGRDMSEEVEHIWGWNDHDMSSDDKSAATIRNRRENYTLK